MGKPFDPFAEDDLEFQPESSGHAPLADVAPAAPARREIVERTSVGREPQRPGRNLKLSFEELNDQGGDVRGASAIGSEQLAADEFLTGMKKQDLDQALQRATVSQKSRPIEVQTETRVARTVRTPLYLLVVGAVLFVGLLVAGGFAFKAYTEQADRAKLEALQRADSKSGH